MTAKRTRRGGPRRRVWVVLESGTWGVQRATWSQYETLDAACQSAAFMQAAAGDNRGTAHELLAYTVVETRE